MESIGQMSYFGLNPAMSLKAATWPPNPSIWSTSGATIEPSRIMVGEIDSVVHTHPQVRFSFEQLEGLAG